MQGAQTGGMQTSLMDADILPQESGVEGPRELPIVDGIPNSQVQSWFREIDTKAKGFITPAEALLFFRRTSLPKETLSKVGFAIIPDTKTGSPKREQFICVPKGPCNVINR